jgi:hypothetical protein
MFTIFVSFVVPAANPSECQEISSICLTETRLPHKIILVKFLMNNADFVSWHKHLSTLCCCSLSCLTHANTRFSTLPLMSILTMIFMLFCTLLTHCRKVRKQTSSVKPLDWFYSVFGYLITFCQLHSLCNFEL